MFVRSLFLSLRMDGPGPTLRRIRERLFGTDERYIFVRYLDPPPAPVSFPVEAKGIAVRDMRGDDLADLQVRRHVPREAHGLFGAVVACRGERIVGAAWYTEAVTPEQPWYPAVAPHLVLPARFTANIFVVPGDKGAAWTLARSASDRLATEGVRTIVGMVGSGNRPSILMTRLLGGRMVARLSVRHRFGRRTVEVEPMTEDRDAAISQTKARATTGRRLRS